MIYFLYGQDSYRSKRKFNEIIEHYKSTNKTGLALNFFDFGESKKTSASEIFSDLKTATNQVSMFREKKLQVFISPFSNKIFTEIFLKDSEFFLKSEDIFLIYEKDEVDQRDSFFKFLEKNAKCQEFNSLGGIKLKNWTP